MPITAAPVENRATLEEAAAEAHQKLRDLLTVLSSRDDTEIVIARAGGIAGDFHRSNIIPAIQSLSTHSERELLRSTWNIYVEAEIAALKAERSDAMPQNPFDDKQTAKARWPLFLICLMFIGIGGLSSGVLGVLVGLGIAIQCVGISIICDLLQENARDVAINKYQAAVVARVSQIYQLSGTKIDKDLYFEAESRLFQTAIVRSVI